MSQPRIYLAAAALSAALLLASGLGLPALKALSSSAPASDIWAIQFGTPANDSAIDLALGPDGTMIVAGQTTGDLAAPNGGGQDAWVAAFDAQGQRLWLHQYGEDANEAAMAVAVDDASDVYVLIVGKSGRGAATTLLSLDADGNQRWSIEVPDTFGAALTVDRSAIYMAGMRDGEAGEESDAASSAFVTAVSPSGAVLWDTSIQDGPGVGITGVAVNQDIIALAGVWDPTEWEPGSRANLRGRLMWAATLNLDGELAALEVTLTPNRELMPLQPNFYTALPPAVISTDQPAGFVMVGAAEETERNYYRYGQTTGWLASRDQFRTPLWRFSDFATSEESTIAVGVGQAGPDRFLVTGLQNAGTTPSTSSALIALADEEVYFDWVTGFGRAITAITRPAVDGAGHIYIAGGTTGATAGPNLGEADIWLAKVANSRVGVPQFPQELAQRVQRPVNLPEAPTKYDNLSGAIVFLANLEAADSEESAARSPHYVYAVQPNGSRLVQISDRPLLNWNGAAAAHDGRYIALSTESSQIDTATKMITIVDPQGNVVYATDHPAGSGAFPLAWSPDDQTVLYLVFQTLPDGTHDNVIYALDLPTLQWTQLTPLDDKSDWDATWTPDGRQIIYESNGLWIMNRDGSDSRLLFDPALLGYPRRVAVSPDGSQIATQPADTFQDAGNWDIWIADINGENARNLTNTPDWDEENPAWSPDGRFVVYNAIPVRGDEPYSGGASRIFVHDLTSGERRILIESGSSVEPQWIPGATTPQEIPTTASPPDNPTGSGTETLSKTVPAAQGELIGEDALVFIQEDALWSIGPGGNQLARLTDPHEVGRITGYTWAASGDELAFISDRGLWRLQVSSGVAEQLLDNSAVGRIVQATWSPTEASIALTAAQDGETPALYVLALDGSLPHRMASNATGVLAWAGPYLVMTSREEGDPARFVAFETRLRIIDPRPNPPHETIVSGGWELPYTEPGRTSLIDVSADQQWIQFNDLGVTGLASVQGVPIADAPFGHWKGDQALITYFKPDRTAEMITPVEYNPATGEENELGSSRLNEIYYDLIRFSPDGQVGALSTDAINLLLPDGSLRPLVDHTAGEFQWAPTGRFILYLRTIQHPQAIANHSDMADVWLDRAGYFVAGTDGTRITLVLPSSIGQVTWRPRPQPGSFSLTLPPAMDNVAVESTDITLAVLVDQLNIRSGPGTGYQALNQVNAGDKLTIVGRNEDESWLLICCVGGERGWVIADPEYVDYTGDVTSLPIVETDRALPLQSPSDVAVPACSTATDNNLLAAQAASNLGCASNVASITWAAYTPFEGGFMLWRRDTQQIYGFFADGSWMAVPDSWDGSSSIPSRGSPPAGRLEPVRGVGWVWGSNDAFFRRLGWAMDEETGFCAEVQPFENGFALRSSTTSRCDANHSNPIPSDRFLYLAAQNKGVWVRP